MTPNQRESSLHPPFFYNTLCAVYIPSGVITWLPSSEGRRVIEQSHLKIGAYNSQPGLSDILTIPLFSRCVSISLPKL